MKKKFLITILGFAFTGVLVFSGWQIHKILSEYESGEEIYGELEEYVATPSRQDSINTAENSSESDEVSEIRYPEVDFAGLSDINSDIVGWIYSEDTPINYPIVQTDDNSYYLKHLFNGEYNSAGSIFLDSRNFADFSDRHTIIYGHHMKNGTMFSSLTDYKKQEYYDAHPTLDLITPEKNYEIDLFAGYVANVKDDAWKLVFDDEEDFQSWIKSAIQKSTFRSSITPAGTDRIITLSTCSYEFDNARYVLVGILKE